MLRECAVDIKGFLQWRDGETANWSVAGAAGTPGRAVTDSCFLRGLVSPSAGRPIKKDWDASHSNFTPERYEKCPVLFFRQSVRQNLLSLQSTADLLATTQNRLATGKKVNSALDNPTNFFTALAPRQPRQRHQQPARRHRQRRAGAAGRQHRHHLAAEAGRHRQVDRQPGAADPGRLLDQVQRDLRPRSPARPRANLLGAGTNNTVTGTAVLNDLTAPVAITAATKLSAPRHRGHAGCRRSRTVIADRQRQDHHLQHGADHGDDRRRGNVTIGVGAGSTLTVSDVLSAIDAHHRHRPVASTVSGPAQLVAQHRHRRQTW